MPDRDLLPPRATVTAPTASDVVSAFGRLAALVLLLVLSAAGVASAQQTVGVFQNDPGAFAVAITALRRAAV